MLKHLSVILSIILLASCMTHNAVDNYDDFVTFQTEESSYYYFDNGGSLIVYIDGSGLSSVLGKAEDNKFTSYSFAYPLSDFFHRTDSILIPEKPGMSFGGVHHSDPDVVKLYTVDNIVDSYVASIDNHLAERQYEEIYIIGVSEGGLLIPKIYTQLKSKNAVSGLVVIGAGGLSQYNCFRIQYDKYPNLHPDYRSQLARLDEAYDKIMKNPHSTDDGYLGWPYSRWSSFMDYSPIEYIKDIEIPMLYVQGKNDMSSPVESAEEVAKLNLKNITVEYLENMGHTPQNSEQINEVFALINNWRS